MPPNSNGRTPVTELRTEIELRYETGLDDPAATIIRTIHERARNWGFEKKNFNRSCRMIHGEWDNGTWLKAGYGSGSVYVMTSLPGKKAVDLSAQVDRWNWNKFDELMNRLVIHGGTKAGRTYHG